MLEISKFISKSALCASDATYIGEVENVYFENSCKKIAYFLIRVTEDKRELLPFDCISSFGDVLTIEDRVSLKNPLDVDLTSLDFDILNKDVYTSLGDFRGRVEKVEFTRAGNVSKMYTDSAQFAPNTISKIGDVILLKSAPKQQKKKVTIPRPQTDYPVYILDEPSLSKTRKQTTAFNAMGDRQPFEIKQSVPTRFETNHDIKTSFDGEQTVSTPINNAQTPSVKVSFQNVGVLQSAPPSVLLSSDDREPMLSSTAFKTLVGETEFDDEHTPTRIICNFDFLIGRVLSRDLRTFGGDIIAYEGTQVDENVLQHARRAGKLVELTLNSEKA